MADHGFIYYFLIALVIVAVGAVITVLVFKVEPLNTKILSYLPSPNSSMFSPVIGQITDMYNSNPIGFIAGVGTIASVVGAPVYKWLSARKEKLAIQEQATQTFLDMKSQAEDQVEQLKEETLKNVDLQKQIDELSDSTLPTMYTELKTQFDLKLSEIKSLKETNNTLQNLIKELKLEQQIVVK